VAEGSILVDLLFSDFYINPNFNTVKYMINMTLHLFLYQFCWAYQCV